MTDLTQYSEKVRKRYDYPSNVKENILLQKKTLAIQERSESVKDILNLGFTAHLESKVESYHILVILCDHHHNQI